MPRSASGRPRTALVGSGDGARGAHEVGVRCGLLDLPPERRGLLAVAGAALLWSTGGLAIKAVSEPALKVACYRSAVAAVVMLAVLRPRLPRWRASFATALVSYAACLTTFVVATKWTTAANAIFLQYSGVAWVLLFSPLVLREPLRAGDALAAVVAFAGMGLFFVGEIDPRGRAGDVVALVSGACFAALILSLRRERDAGAAAAATWGNVLVVAALLPFVVPGAGVSARSALVLVFLGAVQIAAAYALFLYGIRRVTAARAALIGMLEPVANPLWVLLALGERPRGTAVAGGVVVLAAVAWRTVLAARAESEPPVAPDATSPTTVTSRVSQPPR